jgi:voltage-gated potassium channel Kch
VTVAALVQSAKSFKIAFYALGGSVVGEAVLTAWDASSVVLVIGALTGAIVTVLAALTAFVINTRLKATAETVDKIHTSTNSGMDILRNQNAALLARLDAVTSTHLKTAIEERDAAILRIAELEAEVVKRADAQAPLIGGLVK